MERQRQTEAAIPGENADAGTLKISELVVAGAAAALTGAVGTAAALAFPTEVRLAPGAQANVSLAPSQKGLGLAYGPTRLNLPNAGSELPLGVNLSVAELSFRNGQQGSLGEYAALAANYKTAVGQPVKQALEQRAVEGFGGGFAVAATLGFVALKRLASQRRREALAAQTLRQKIVSAQTAAHDLDNPEINQAVAELAEVATPEAKRRRPRRLIAAVLAGALATSGFAGWKASQPTEAKPPSSSIALDGAITSRFPALKGATISGPGASLINAGATEIVSYIDRADDTWAAARHNFQTELAKFNRRGGLDFLNDPNKLAILHMSDIHCNQAYIKLLFPALVRAFQPPIIVNSGDTLTNSNTMPYEASCFPVVAQQLKAATRADGVDTTMVNVDGNHDAKISVNLDNKDDIGEKYKLITTLDKQRGYSYSPPGENITFVGDSDPTRSTWGPTEPADPAKLNTLVAAQGETLARAACQAKHANPQSEVIAVTHRRQAGFETIARGCADLVLNGHTHINGPISAYRSEDGRVVWQHVGGTASGAHGGISLYSPPTTKATATLMIFDTTSQKFDEFLNIIVSPAGVVAIEPAQLPTRAVPLSRTKDIDDFLAQYPSKSDSGKP